MCATPHPKHTKVLGVLTGDDAAHTAFARAAIGYPSAVAALPTAMAKKGQDSQWRTRAGGKYFEGASGEGGKGIKGVFPGNGGGEYVEGAGGC
jgi:hypothetical protein